MRELRIPHGLSIIENEYNDLSEYDVLVIPASVRIIRNSFNNAKSITKILFETEIDDSLSSDVYTKNSICPLGVGHICDSFNGIKVDSVNIP